MLFNLLFDNFYELLGEYCDADTFIAMENYNKADVVERGKLNSNVKHI